MIKDITKGNNYNCRQAIFDKLLGKAPGIGFSSWLYCETGFIARGRGGSVRYVWDGGKGIVMERVGGE